MERRFPLRAYGVKKGSEQYKKMFPHDFKKYFFDVLSNMKKNKDGDLIRPKSVRRTFFLPSGAVGSVPNQKNEFDNLYDKKVEKAAIRERAFKREDTKEVRANIMMTQHEVENCTFEPAVGKQDPHWQFKKQYYPPDEENKTWVDKFGTNF